MNWLISELEILSLKFVSHKRAAVMNILKAKTLKASLNINAVKRKH